MFAFLYNPDRFMAFSRWAAPMFGALAAVLAAVGLWLDFAAPPDYQQGYTIHIMFIHVPASMLSLFVYLCLGVASFLSLVFRQALAEAAALWGKPMWGTWWVWDARLTSELVLLLFYLGYMALQAAIDDEARAARACAILALVGVVNLPIVVFSVDWWNTLHQGSTLFAKGGPAMAPVYLPPFLIMILAYTSAFGSLWLVRIRGEVWRRRANVLAVRAAR